MHESYTAILTRAGQDALIVKADAAAPLELMRWSMHSTSAVS